jgi:phospholipid/cholesterol/gamma-HCH transport system substrate-binding protein
LIGLLNVLWDIKILFLLGVGLIALAFFILTAGNFKVLRRGYLINVFFTDVGGLEEGASVRMSGLEIGYVKKTSIVNGKVKVSLWINRSIRIREDAKVSIGSLGIMGEKYVSIMNIGTRKPFLKNGDTLSGESPPDPAYLLIQFRQLLSKLEGLFAGIETEGSFSLKEDVILVVRNLKEILGENRQNIKNSIEGLLRLSDELKILLEKFASQFSKATSDFSTSLLKINESVEKLNTKLDNIKDLVLSVAQLSQVPSQKVETQLKEGKKKSQKKKITKTTKTTTKTKKT